MRANSKYQNYLPEEHETRMTQSGYVNMENEMWENLQNDRMIPLAEQRKPMHYYFGKDYIDMSEINNNLTDMNKLSKSQIFYGNFFEDWTEYQTPEGMSYWHNSDLNLSTWDDPQFILSILKSNHVENSLDMIPDHWDSIEGTPFIELVMKNGKTLFLHRTFKSVFYENPLIQHSEVKQITNKMQKENKIMEAIKNSKLKRRMAKEQEKLQNLTEMEVSIKILI